MSNQQSDGRRRTDKPHAWVDRNERRECRYCLIRSTWPGARRPCYGIIPAAANPTPRKRPRFK